MDIETKTEFIEEFMRNYALLPETYNNDEYITFKIYNDLGIPLAQAYAYDLVELTASGEDLINETWDNFCKLFEKDPNGEYENLEDILNFE